MKVFAFIVTVLFTAVALTSSLVLLVVLTPTRQPVWVGLAGVAVGVFLYAGTLLGSLRAYWDIDGSTESRTVYRRWLVGALIAEGAAAVLLISYTVATAAPWWIAALYIGVGVILTALAPRIGAALRRRDARRLTSAVASEADDAIRIRRKILGIGITFVVAFIISAVGLLVLNSVLDGGPGDFAMTFLYALAFASLAAAFAAIIGSLSVNRWLRSIASDDLGRVRRFVRVILRGKKDEIGDEEAPAAVAYAELAPLALNFQIAWLTLLYAGIGLQQVAGIVARPDDSLFPVILVAGLAAFYVAFMPLMIAQIRRARRYRATHDSGPLTATA